MDFSVAKQQIRRIEIREFHYFFFGFVTILCVNTWKTPKGLH